MNGKNIQPDSQKKRLSDSHWQMLIKESGIQPETVAARGYRTVTKKSQLKDLGFKDCQCGVPALVIPVYSPFGEFALYQARPDTPRIKAGKPIKYETLAGSRMVLDCHPSLRHRLRDPAIPLWITEGVKKGDSLISHECCAIALLGVWNWRGTNEQGGKTALADWESVALNDRTVFLVFDSDLMTKSSIHAALSRLKGFLEQRRAKVFVIYLPLDNPRAKMGVDDYLVNKGTVQDLISLASSELRPPLVNIDSESKKAMPIIETAGRHLRDISDESLSILQQANIAPDIYRRGTTLTRLVRSERGPQVEPFTVPSLKRQLDRAADFMKTKMHQDGEAVSIPARPPIDVVLDLLVHPDPPFPVLTEIATVPVFLPDGTLLAQEGYHPETGLFLSLRGLGSLNTNIPLPKARSLLVDELLGDFPFVSNASQTHALALLLQRFLRPLILGPTPLYLINAPARGTGKGLLAEILTLITIGQPAPVMPFTNKESETEKRVTALLLSGAQVILFDNVTTLKSSTLAAALTAQEWQGRVLGQSQIINVPNRAMWVATGNNVELSDELVRRSISIRLDAGIERPEERQEFRHPDLITWVQENRAYLVSACLSIIKAWTQAGQPSGTRTLGRYESWAFRMGGLLEFCGLSGFLEEQDRLYRESDKHTQGWIALCKGWHEVHGEQPVTAKDLFEVAKTRQLLLEIWAGRKDLAAQQRFGHALSAHRDRVFGQFRIRQSGRDSHTGNIAYILERVPTAQHPKRKTPETLQTPHPLLQSEHVSGVSGVSGEGEMNWETPEVIDLVN